MTIEDLTAKLNDYRRQWVTADKGYRAVLERKAAALKEEYRRDQELARRIARARSLGKGGQ